MAAVDVLIVSLGSTSGLRASDAELRDGMQRAGARVAVCIARRPPEVRTLALTDLAWAWAARRAALAAIAEHAPRAILYSTATAALLWPRPGAIRYDAPAAANRQGRHGLWQRPLERRRLARAPLLVAVDPVTLVETAEPHAPAIVVPIPVEPTVAAAGGDAADDRRDIAAMTYATNPAKKGLDRVADAWRRTRRDGERLVVAGLAPGHPAARAALAACPEGIELVGRLEPGAYRALLRRARVFVCAPRREDYGIAQLEALADGCLLVTTPAPGPYAALALARALDARLVTDLQDGLAGALRTALDDPLPGYAERAAQMLVPYGRDAVDAVIARDLLPRLLP